ncbi:MAG TPA: family 10 glycosylhydrolase [Coleofasciculaceae cyanobacterium]
MLKAIAWNINRKLQTCFIYWLCLGLVIALSTRPPQVVASSPTTPASTELRGVWLTNVASPLLFIPWGVKRALHQLSLLNFNTVYPVVWNQGHTFYSYFAYSWLLKVELVVISYKLIRTQDYFPSFLQRVHYDYTAKPRL